MYPSSPCVLPAAAVAAARDAVFSSFQGSRGQHVPQAQVCVQGVTDLLHMPFMIMATHNTHRMGVDRERPQVW